MLLLIAACLPDLGAEPEGAIWSNPDVLDTAVSDTEPVRTDEDQDGYALEEGDCNDDDPSVHPDALDFCDGRDQDCDGDIDEDAEGDGYEPNDTTASDLGAVTDSSVEVIATLSSEDDVDIFAFNTDDWYYVGPDITVRLGDIGANSDYAVALYSPDGVLLGEANDKGAGKAEKLMWSGELTKVESGVYTVEVWSVGGADCAREYTLELSED